MGSRHTQAIAKAFSDLDLADEQLRRLVEVLIAIVAASFLQGPVQLAAIRPRFVGTLREKRFDACDPDEIAALLTTDLVRQARSEVLRRGRREGVRPR